MFICTSMGYIFLVWELIYVVGGLFMKNGELYCDQEVARFKL